MGILGFLHERLGDLVRYRDHALPPREQERVEAHLRECERCREKLEFLVFVEGNYRQAAGGLPAADDGHLAPGDFAAYIERAARAKERGRIELHLARCGDCLTELMRMKTFLRQRSAAEQRPSEGTLRAVLAMGTRSSPSTRRDEQGILVGVRGWLWPEAGPWRRGLVAAGAALVVVLATFSVMRWAALPDRGPATVETPPRPGTPQVVFERKIPMTPAIAESVSAYEKGRGSKESEDVLVRSLAQVSRELPVAQIKRLELDAGLLARGGPGGKKPATALGLRMQLSQDGTLRLTPVRPPTMDRRSNPSNESTQPPAPGGATKEEK